MLLIGYRTKAAAWLLAIYWLGYTLIVYSFWNDPIEYQRTNALGFMNNMAILGALLLLASKGAGRYSIRRILHVMRLPS